MPFEDCKLIVPEVGMSTARAIERGIYQFYLELANFVDAEVVPSDAATGLHIEEWMVKVDACTQPADLRRYLQGDEANANELILGALARRYRHLNAHDKFFITVAEYLYRFAPAWFQEHPQVSMAEVAEVLEPVLGPAGELPAWLPQLEVLISELVAYEHLHEMTEFGIFERGRQLKTRVAAHGLDTMGLVAFARFNYVLRKTFSTLWAAELWWIEQALTELESRADFFIDCRELGLSPIVPTNELLHMACQWKRPSFTDYAQDVMYRKVQKVKQILETALLPEMAYSAPR